MSTEVLYVPREVINISREGLRLSGIVVRVYSVYSVHGTVVEKRSERVNKTNVESSYNRAGRQSTVGCL